MYGAAKTLQVIDSHTGGEPTRVVVGGGPVVPAGNLLRMRELLEREHDWMRSACVTEPRGHQAMVGAFLCPSEDKTCVTAVIFFNNVGYLNNCIHGIIGVAETLAHLGRIGVGEYRIETPVGVVTATRDAEGRVTVANVPCYRFKKECSLEVTGYGSVTGDIAWGGNWFFLIDRQGPEVRFSNIEPLTAFTWAVRQALEKAGITGEDGALIDHIEVFGPPQDTNIADSRNFVLCPGKAYDRSPCGTGTSAKLACLAADGHLQAGEVWRQASILDTVFEGWVVSRDGGDFQPHISGRAFVNAEATIIVDPDDPFRHGINFQNPNEHTESQS